jgi:hypothetical protein
MASILNRFRFGSKADIADRLLYVRFTPKSGHGGYFDSKQKIDFYIGIAVHGYGLRGS